MTRQDYILLAEALYKASPVHLHVVPANNIVMQAYHLQHSDCCNNVADALAAQSRGFDRELFLRNCGVQS